MERTELKKLNKEVWRICKFSRILHNSIDFFAITCRIKICKYHLSGILDFKNKIQTNTIRWLEPIFRFCRLILPNTNNHFTGDEVVIFALFYLPIFEISLLIANRVAATKRPPKYSDAIALIKSNNISTKNSFRKHSSTKDIYINKTSLFWCDSQPSNHPIQPKTEC